MLDNKLKIWYNKGTKKQKVGKKLCYKSLIQKAFSL